MPGEDAAGPPADLDIVIANWNSGDLLRGCISALAESTMASRVKVIVVDNASRDGSSERLNVEGLNMEIVRNPDNRGFGAACNQGATRGRAPFLLFLNPDTRVARDTLARAVGYLRAPEQDRVGVVGVRLVDDAGRTQRTCAREPTFSRLLAHSAGLDRLVPRLVRPHFLTDWDHEQTDRVDQVMGAFLLIRRELFDHLQGFDERYFVYYEDVDLCARVRQAGREVVHYAEVQAWHHGGGTTNQVKDRRLFYMMRSQILYVDKWFGQRAALIMLLVALGVHVPLRAAVCMLSLAPKEALAALHGGWLLARDLPALRPVLGHPRRAALEG
jgi:N-acetylglucosaminyl-diphospho-decaprenol L-rhamnosyltransferase